MIREDEVARKQEQKFGGNTFGTTSTGGSQQDEKKIMIDTNELLDTAIKSAASSVATVIITRHLLKDE